MYGWEDVSLCPKFIKGIEVSDNGNSVRDSLISADHIVSIIQLSDIITNELNGVNSIYTYSVTTVNDQRFYITSDQLDMLLNDFAIKAFPK